MEPRPEGPGHPGAKPTGGADRPSGAESEPEAAEPQSAGPPGTHHRCDLCGAPMLEQNCKIVCLNCGYQRDCSDP